jgi:hypothetical protein
MCALYLLDIILDILCPNRWMESLGIMISVCVCFLYIANSSFVFLRHVLRSIKSMELCFSFSMVNFILVCCLLNSAKVSSIIVFFWF